MVSVLGWLLLTISLDPVLTRTQTGILAQTRKTFVVETGKEATLICQPPKTSGDTTKFSWYQENKWLDTTSVSNTLTIATDDSLTKDASDLYSVHRPDMQQFGIMSYITIKKVTDATIGNFTCVATNQQPLKILLIEKRAVADLELKVDSIALSKRTSTFDGDKIIVCSAKGFGPMDKSLKIQLYLGGDEIHTDSTAARAIDKEGSEKAKVEVYRTKANFSVEFVLSDTGKDLSCTDQYDVDNAITVVKVFPRPSTEEITIGSVAHVHNRNGTFGGSEDTSAGMSTKQKNALIIGLSVPILSLVALFAVYYFGRKSWARRFKPQTETPPADEAQKDADVVSMASSSSGNASSSDDD